MFEAMATAEAKGDRSLSFGEKGKKRIIEALRLVSSQEQAATLEATKLKATRIFEIVTGGLPDHIILAGHDKWTPSQFMRNLPGFDESVFEQIMVNTLDEAQNGKSVKQRVEVYRRLLRNGGQCITIKQPRPEAIAVYLVREVFRECGMKAKVLHTRPTSEGEGNEAQSAFEKFAFAYILPDIGSDDAAKKVLLRRLQEAERALSNSARF
ncbi:hypothetical protein [Cognatishimia activa]|uniref:Uncharacterized protein n=1 Tax=Cognatishimia activa TaxID=1715691 RepID=A0A975I689_9RHOB|nr:hypothetical protein [Cognatishimia activa]QTN34843.1 hypothetical protein HZ995_10040 [Cognatishimia activa]